MIFMEKDKQSIVKLIEVLVNPVAFLAKVRLFASISRSDDYIFEYYQKGNVNENLLLLLLRKSVCSKRIKALLPDILYYVDAHSISDRVMAFIISYPGEFRETLLSLMAHMWLTVEHLELINDNIHTPEAFCKLFCIYAEDADCSEEKFHKFLCENEYYLNDVDCFALINSQHINISNTKLSLLRHMISAEADHK